MATASKPERLHYTGNDEADRLIAGEPFALLMGFALDQQVPVPTAFSGPLKLKQRLGTLDPDKIASTIPRNSRPPSGKSRRSTASRATCLAEVQELAAIVAGEYGDDAGRIWTEASDGADLHRRLAELPGFGEMTIKSLSAVLAKRFGVEARGSWRRPTRRLAMSIRPKRSRLTSHEARAQSEAQGAAAVTPIETECGPSPSSPQPFSSPRCQALRPPSDCPPRRAAQSSRARIRGTGASTSCLSPLIRRR
jgi:uncharacterized HhH-GPD family protein